MTKKSKKIENNINYFLNYWLGDNNKKAIKILELPLKDYIRQEKQKSYLLGRKETIKEFIDRKRCFTCGNKKGRYGLSDWCGKCLERE